MKSVMACRPLNFHDLEMAVVNIDKTCNNQSMTTDAKLSTLAPVPMVY
jgi:hypothetical protein